MRQQITETVRVAREPDRLWREIGAFGAIGTWHPMLAGLEAEGERAGALRTAHGKDGSVQIERLLAMAPERRAYRYEMVSTALPVANYAAEFQVEDPGNGTSTVRWNAAFDVTSGDTAGTTAGIRAFLRAGLDSLATRYGGCTST